MARVRLCVCGSWFVGREGQAAHPRAPGQCFQKSDACLGGTHLYPPLLLAFAMREPLCEMRQITQADSGILVP